MAADQHFIWLMLFVCSLANLGTRANVNGNQMNANAGARAMAYAGTVRDYFARGIDFVASRAIAINNCAAGLMLSFFKVTIAGLCFALESLFRAQELAALP